MYNLRQKIRLWAIYSRSLVLVIQFLVDVAIPDYSPTEESIVSEINQNSEKNFTFEWIHPLDLDDGEGDKVVQFLFGGLFKDEEAQIFGHVADRGYTYELTLGQFPLLPLVVRTVAQGLEWLTTDFYPVLHFASLVKISCIGLNFIAFILAADLLYSLSRRVLQDEYLAYKAVLLFCLTPTAVLFSGGHVESCLAAATFGAMLILERSGLGFTSGLMLAVCTSIHATGLLHLGLVLHKSMKQVATRTILYVREKKKNSAKTGKGKNPSGNPVPTTPGLWNVFVQISMGAFFPGVWNLVLSLFPFAAFQWFSFAAFCRLTSAEVELSEDVIKYGKANGLKMPGFTDKPDWCKNDPPISYFVVESMNWQATDESSTKGIDILIYWTLGQLPYLISSAPTLALVFWQSFIFLKVHRRFCFRLGLVDNTHLGMVKPRAAPVTRTRALPRECLVYLFHALTLASAGFFTLPIQIANRLILCSSPVMYWIGAVVTTPSENELVPSAGPEDENSMSESEAALKVEKAANLKKLHSTILLLEGPSDDLGNSTKIFFLGYCVIGTILHVNSYPWT